MLSLRPLVPWIRDFFPAVLLTIASSCGGSAAAPSAGPSAENDVLAHLEARGVAAGGALGRASYQKKRAGAELTQELEVQVEKAPPGKTHAVTLDGLEIGRLVTDLDGEAELEYGEDRALPAGFVEPSAGSELRIGELLTLRLEPLERLVHLEANVASGKVAGKVSYKVERLAGQVTREFKLKLSGLPKDSVQPLRIGAIPIGDLAVESDGKGKLEFADAGENPFPAGFPDPEVGTVVHVGTVVRAEFLSRLTVQDRGGGE